MTVFSRMHLLLENVPIEPNPKENGYDILTKMKNAPGFVIQRDALEMLTRTDCIGAIQAMIEASIFKLPYPEMRLEWQSREGIPADLVGTYYGSTELEPVHEFILLKEGENNTIHCEYAFLFVKSRVGGIYRDWFKITPRLGEWEVAHYKDTDLSMKRLALGPCMMAINVALVLMNMKGIERETHACEPLNKARVKKGKPAIPQYSYIRIGHVYKSDGSRIKYTDGDHRHLPMHVRSAHTRNQPFGKGREETRLVYIPSVIVNFAPGETLPIPKQKIVKA